MTTGKTIALTGWTLVGKVMSLLLNMLSRLVITLLPRSKHLLVSWLQSPCAVILEPQKIKSDTVSTVSPSISHEMMGPDAKQSNKAILFLLNPKHCSLSFNLALVQKRAFSYIPMVCRGLCSSCVFTLSSLCIFLFQFYSY